MDDEHGAENSDEVKLTATLPMRANAIGIDGGANEGGCFRLEVDGTDIAPLLRLTKLRGRKLLVTLAPMQKELDLSKRADEIPAGDGKSEALFGETPATTSPSGDTPPVDGTQSADGSQIPDHVHRYQNNVCVECGVPREPIPAPAAAVRARRVSRGLIGKKKAKR